MPTARRPCSGHGTGQLSSLSGMVTRRPNWLDVERSITTSARFTTCRSRALSPDPLRPRRQDAPRRARDPGGYPLRTSQTRARQGRDRQGLGGLPACRRKAATASSSRRRFVLHRMPKHIRTVCLEFFGRARDAVPSIVEIKSYLDAVRARCSRGWSISTSAT